MLARDVGDEVHAMLEAFALTEHLDSAIDVLSAAQDTIRSAIAEQLGASGDASQVVTRQQHLIKTLHQKIADLKKLSPRLVFNDISVLEAALLRYFPDSTPADSTSKAPLQKALSLFSDSYERFIGSYSVPDALLLFDSGSRLQHALRAARSLLGPIPSSLEPRFLVAPGSGTTVLSLCLASPVTLPDFARKLTAIHDLYSELAQLVDAPPDQRTARVLKLESGSPLWADILGYPKVIELLKWLIENGVRFLHRSYSRDGQISAIPRSVASIEAILELNAHMRSAGIDTAPLQHEIAKASVSVAKHLNTLLASEPRVTIDLQVFSVGADVEQRYIAEARTRLLVDGSPAADEGTSNEGDAVSTS